jgi:hypothetical protein
VVETTGYVGEKNHTLFHHHPDGKPGSSDGVTRLFGFAILTIGFAILARNIRHESRQTIDI